MFQESFMLLKTFQQQEQEGVLYHPFFAEHQQFVSIREKQCAFIIALNELSRLLN